MSTPTTYDKILAEQYGGPEVLKVTTEPLPEPGPGEARVRIEAAGVGYTDTIVRRGRYREYKGGLPVTPGYDLVGTVDAVGPGVTGVVPGQRVADMPIHGSYSQYAVRPARDLLPVPDGIEPGVAVEVPLMWITAWQMLTRCVHLAEGDTILVVGASGSVGRALTVLGRHLGLRVVGTCSAANTELVESWGATAVDYRSADLPAALRTAIGAEGAAAAFDGIGGQSWRTCRSVLARGGTLVGYGMQDFLDGRGATTTAVLNMLQIRTIWRLTGRLDRTRRGAEWYDISIRRGEKPDEFAADAAELFGLIAEGAVAPAQPEILPLAAAAEAHRRIARGGLERRLVLDPWAATA